MSDTKSPKFIHQRHTMLVRFTGEVGLRDTEYTEPAHTAVRPPKDSEAATCVCYRVNEDDSVDFLTFKYTIRGKGAFVTWRFPTETKEVSDLDINSVVISCLHQEIVSKEFDEQELPVEITGPVFTEERPSDANRISSRKRSEEVLGVPKWIEAQELYRIMEQRGIESHRKSLISALKYLATKHRSVSLRYGELIDSVMK